MVKCAKLGKEAPGLAKPPFKNELGQRIYENVSHEAWRAWIDHSTMLINEFRVDVMSPQGREFLLKEAEKFFFGEGSAAPPDFKPQ
jgi:Fe-S cluster biosynthesis and repair protein YggX